mmetsp:Transcript_63712/g.94610  ORF Transcript_63712/g.94610 Transcript_63712/m.94610 type:complete len:163 (+) Transcript_63712:3359-3847(+)
MAANWSMSKPIAPKKTVENSDSDDDDDDDDDSEAGKDLWGAAKKEAASSKAREADRKALDAKIQAETERTKKQRIADANAQAEQMRLKRLEEEEKEARLREEQEREAEAARKAARQAAIANVQNVEQTVDLDLQRDIMKQYEQNFMDKEFGGGASPSSDFGF